MQPVFVCLFCKHFFGPYPYKWNQPPTCEAFQPNPIPDDMLNCKREHLKPFPGDHGLQFEDKFERVED